MINMKIKLLFSFLFFSIYLNAQLFTNYTVDDGLINNTVNCLAIDDNDNLWFGTQEGVSFFDGTDWTNYDVNSHPELINNTITAIAVDADGNVWLGTDFGVSKFDGTTFTNYTDDDGLADNRVKYINQDAVGNIWIANNDGISIFDGTSNWTNYTMADGLPFGGANFVTFDNDGNTWIGTPLGGVFIFDGNEFTTITEDDGLLSDKIRSIAIDDNGIKWIGTADGISVFNANNEFVNHHELIFVLPPPDELNPVTDVQIGEDGVVWVGVYVDYLVTEGGVSFYNSGWDDYDVGDGLVGPVVRRLEIDSENSVWVATSTGVTKISDIQLSVFDEKINNEINIYPNPTSHKLNINVPAELINSEFKLFNSIGVLMDKGNIPHRSFNLGVSNFSNGIYFLSVDGVYNRKVVIQR